MNPDSLLFPSPLQVLNTKTNFFPNPNGQPDSIKDAEGGIVTAVTLAYSPFTSYTKVKDGRIQPGDCIDFRILDTIADFYKITVRTEACLFDFRVSA